MSLGPNCKSAKREMSAIPTPFSVHEHRQRNLILLEQNVENLPIDSCEVLVYVSKKTVSVNALDTFWLKKNQEYPSLNYFECDNDNDEYALKKYNTFLSELLVANFSCFWSEMCFRGTQVHSSLMSFVRNFSSHLQLNNESEVNKRYIGTIHDKFIVIIQRMLTSKDSEKVWITEKKHSEILKRSSLINIELLSGIVRLYDYNEKLIFYTISKACKMCAFIDKATEITEIFQELKDIRTNLLKLESQLKRNHCDSQCLNNVKCFYRDFDKTKTILNGVIELSQYDPQIAQHLLSNKLDYFLVDFYNNTLPDLCAVFEKLPSVYRSLIIQVDLHKIILFAANEMISFYINNVISNSLDEPKAEYWFEKFMDFLNDSFSDYCFMRDYNRNFQLMEEFEKISVFCSFIKKDRWCHVDDYLTYFESEVDKNTNLSKQDLQSTLRNELDIVEQIAYLAEKNNSTIKDIISKTLENKSIPHDTICNENKKDCEENKQIGCFSDKELQEITIDSLITQVMDIVPNIGDGYAEECLKVFEFNAEETISALLEDRLPPELRKIDPQLIRIPPDDLHSSSTSNFKNISHISHGKNTDRLTNDMLNDKSEISKLKDFYQQFKHVTIENDCGDEYENAKSVEINSRKFECGRGEDKSSDENEHRPEVADDSKAKSSGKNSSLKPFCRDPALIRAERERNKPVHHRKGPAASNSSVVVGNAKGQGQSKETLRQRSNKNVHKSTRANHNRKSGASWKQSKGMF